MYPICDVMEKIDARANPKILHDHQKMFYMTVRRLRAAQGTSVHNADRPIPWPSHPQLRRPLFSDPKVSDPLVQTMLRNPQGLVDRRTLLSSPRAPRSIRYTSRAVQRQGPQILLSVVMLCCPILVWSCSHPQGETVARPQNWTETMSRAEIFPSNPGLYRSRRRGL